MDASYGDGPWNRTDNKYNKYQRNGCRASIAAVSKPTKAKGLNCLKECLIKLSNVLYLPVLLEDKKLEGRTTPSVFKVSVPQMKLNVAMTFQQQCPT